MKPWAKISLVLVGYAAAMGAAVAAGWLCNVRMAAQPYDTSGGMYAWGEMLTSLSAFLMVALAPTLLWLWFLRRNERLWNMVAILSIAFAGIGLVAVLEIEATRSAMQRGALVLLDLVGIAHLVGSPLWVITFVLFAVLAPTPRIRQRLIVALGIQLLVGVVALVHWFVPALRW